MTLLCLNAANTHTVLGAFDGEELLASWRVASDERRTCDEWYVLLDGLLRGVDVAPVHALSLCCTVPAVLREMRALFQRYYADLPAVIVGPGVRTGVPILTDNPREVGADRVVNALAAMTRYGGPVVVVDIGAATTVDAVDAGGRFIGGAIAPGIATSVEALRRHGAQLRLVEMAEPRGVIGKNTVDALQAGTVYGFAGLVDGIVARMVEELGDGADRPVEVVATGVLAEVVVGECRTVTSHDPHLTLTGLRLVQEKNRP